MLKVMRLVVIAIAVAAVGLAAYLGARVADMRTKAPERVAAILAERDPAVDRLSDQRLAMLIKIEDPTFWTNKGVDLRTPGAGQTTLSQGLGKRIFFRQFRPGAMRQGKLELIVLTRFALIPTVSKRDILTAVLSTAYLGRDGAGPINGFAEGARRWHGVELDALDDGQFLSLVAMLPAPNSLAPGGEANARRVRRIERFLSGRCTPDGVNDIWLEGCDPPN